MKSAYDLAMERLTESDPNAVQSLTDEQRAQLAEIDEKYRAKIAEREIFLQSKMVQAQQSDPGEAKAIEKQLQSERARLENERDSAKNKVREAAQ